MKSERFHSRELRVSLHGSGFFDRTSFQKTCLQKFSHRTLLFSHFSLLLLSASLSELVRSRCCSGIGPFFFSLFIYCVDNLAELRMESILDDYNFGELFLNFYLRKNHGKFLVLFMEKLQES